MSEPVLVLLGEAPARPGDEPWKGKVGRRLAYLMGVEYRTLLNSPRIVRLNLSQGRPLVGVQAREAVASLCETWAARRTCGLVVLAGAGVTQAAGYSEMPPFVPFDLLTHAAGLLEAVVVPDLSGKNRWWNQPANEAQARRYFNTLREFATAQSIFVPEMSDSFVM